MPVAYIRRFSDKLQIEMLRAYKPETFKSAGVNVNIGACNNILVLSEEQRHRLMAYNRQWLLEFPHPDAGRQLAPVEPEGVTH